MAKQEWLVKISLLLALLASISLYRGLLDLSILPLWIGGILGLLMPDLDKLYYTYVVNPKTKNNLSKDQFLANRDEFENKVYDDAKNSSLVTLFHTANFQLFFVVLGFFVVSSTASMLGKGVVVGFLLHLLVEQVMTYLRSKNIDAWFRNFVVGLDANQKRVYLVANGLAILFFAFFF